MATSPHELLQFVAFAALLSLTLQGCGGGGGGGFHGDFPTAQCPTAVEPATSAIYSRSPASASVLRDGGSMAAAQALGQWNKLHRAAPHASRELLFVVKQKNLDKVENMLYERSDPTSSSYGQWLSEDEVHQLTMNTESMKAVKEALKSVGAEIMTVTRGGELVRARASTKMWEEFLQTEFHAYESKLHNRTHVAAQAYRLPLHLQDHLEGVLGCVDFPDVSAKPPLRLRTSAIQGKLTPDMLRAAYNVPAPAEDGSKEALARKNTSQAVFGSLGQNWSPSDRLAFQKKYNLPGTPVKDLSDETGSHDSDDLCTYDPSKCTEANLDVQYMSAMSPWSQMGFWYMDIADGSFVDFVEALLSHKSPEVVSISYGGFEFMHTRQVVETFNTAAMKLGLQGVTLVAASGDDGAEGGLWKDKDLGCIDTQRFGYPVFWPASSPYVTGIGATMGVESGQEEVACQVKCMSQDGDKCEMDVYDTLITSGGGYSKYEKPKYQQDHVTCNGRGVPDVSLAGHSYNVIVGGEEQAVDGTSASAPTFAGMVSLVNARRKAAGSPTVGFINPAMYKNPSAFKDITKGDNKCGGMSTLVEGYVPCCGGYEASQGWDAVTGLGSVDFVKFEGIFPISPTSVTTTTGMTPKTTTTLATGKTTTTTTAMTMTATMTTTAQKVEVVVV